MYQRMGVNFVKTVVDPGFVHWLSMMQPESTVYMNYNPCLILIVLAFSLHPRQSSDSTFYRGDLGT